MLINCLNVCYTKKNHCNHQNETHLFSIIARVEPLIKNKSVYQLRLEDALKENKASIFRLKSNRSIVVELRKQRNDLITNLTLEIQRAFSKQIAISKKRRSFHFLSNHCSCLYLENITKSLSTSSTASTNTVNSSFRAFSTEMTSVKMNIKFHLSSLRKNTYLTIGSINNNIKILLIISCCFCIFILAFRWIQPEGQGVMKSILICLLLFFCSYFAFGVVSI